MVNYIIVQSLYVFKQLSNQNQIKSNLTFVSSFRDDIRDVSTIFNEKNQGDHPSSMIKVK